MDQTNESDPGRARPRTDLVEYLVVTARDVGSASPVADAYVQLCRAGTLRVLDAVLVEHEPSGQVVVRELDTLDAMAELSTRVRERGLLSERDIERAVIAVPRGEVALIVVTEDRWAEPLSRAAAGAGGRIIGGDRIPADRASAALSIPTIDEGAER